MTNRSVVRRFRNLACAAALAVAFAALPPPAHGQQPPEPPAGFVPADSLPAQEPLPAAPLVIGAYAIAWVLIFGYIWSLWRRLGRVEQELSEVRRRVEGGARR